MWSGRVGGPGRGPGGPLVLLEEASTSSARCREGAYVACVVILVRSCKPAVRPPQSRGQGSVPLFLRLASGPWGSQRRRPPRAPRVNEHRIQQRPRSGFGRCEQTWRELNEEQGAEAVTFVLHTYTHCAQKPPKCLSEGATEPRPRGCGDPSQTLLLSSMCGQHRGPGWWRRRRPCRAADTHTDSPVAHAGQALRPPAKESWSSS